MAPCEFHSFFHTAVNTQHSEALIGMPHFLGGARTVSLLNFNYLSGKFFLLCQEVRTPSLPPHGLSRGSCRFYKYVQHNYSECLSSWEYVKQAAEGAAPEAVWTRPKVEGELIST